MLYEPFRGFSTIERPVGGDPLADDSPQHVRVTPVGLRWAGLEHALDAG